MRTAIKSWLRERSGRKPRLLLVSPLPPPAGGIATWTQRLSRTELYGRYEIRILNTNTGRADAQIAGVTPRKAALGFSFVRQFALLMLTYRPDIVHINTSGFMPLMIIEAIQSILARQAGAAVIFHVRGSMNDTWERTSPTLRPLQGAIFRGASRVLTLHESGTEVLERHGVQGRVISNFVMTREAPDRAERTGPVQVLFVGWIMPYKGVLELIEAAGQVPGLELVLLGRVVNNSTEQIEEAIDAAGLRDRITLPGEVPLAEVWSYYDDADVFALPSWTEGFPNTLVEAMMSGLPALYTDVGAMAEMQIDGTTGIEVPVRDAGAIASALKRLVEDPDLRRGMGEAARARALAEYEMSQVLHRLCDHYDELVGCTTRPPQPTETP